MRQLSGASLAVVETPREVGDVVAKRGDALACDLLADEVADQQAKEGLALQRREAHGRARVVAQRRETLVGERVHGAFTGLPGLLAGGEIAEPREPLRLGVVLALAGPGEHPAPLCEPQEVVGAGAGSPDEAENLVGEEAELTGRHETGSTPRWTTY